MIAWRLLIHCTDQPGLVHQVTGLLFKRGCNVIVNHEFADADAGRFFMRTEFTGDLDPGDLVEDCRSVLPGEAVIRLTRPSRARLVVLVSREHHCLADLLVRHEFGELPAEVVGVIGNHAELGSLTGRFGVPFQHVSHDGLSREEHERRLLERIRALAPDYLVLAKYMRVLSPEFVAQFAGRMINIHHSFLPAFVGSRPYHQAFARGVKVIGATAHFVTDELDAGPIIVQELLPVDHTHSPQDLARSGRDVERLALAKALRMVLEDRVFLNGNRTVIFD
ncbi:MAG TPA: formyltetrahydrofolate deformylase [Verrucomicrobiales bacterium]|nr:formyltetrahydrofolate deformylase [Verrucomicrobiales bacterium]